MASESRQSDQRRESALQMAERLDESGVREIFVSDGRQRLVVHFAENLPLHVGP